MKRAIALALSVVITISTLAGCSSKAPTDEGKTVNEAQTTETGSEATSDEKKEDIKISLFLQDSADHAISTDLPIIQEITKTTGVNFEFIAAPNTEDQFKIYSSSLCDFLDDW